MWREGSGLSIANPRDPSAEIAKSQIWGGTDFGPKRGEFQNFVSCCCRELQNLRFYYFSATTCLIHLFVVLLQGITTFCWTAQQLPKVIAMSCCCRELTFLCDLAATIFWPWYSNYTDPSRVSRAPPSDLPIPAPMNNKSTFFF